MAITAQVVREDRLGEGDTLGGQVIINYGDPALPRDRHDSRRLSPREALFLRIVAYLAFAETVCLPARYILSCSSTFGAVKLAEPLLVEGVLRPERRSEVDSYEDLAIVLGLDGAARQRGQWLDERAAHTRAFRSEELAKKYREVLLDDLAPDGGLRRVLPSAQRAALSGALDLAYNEYQEVEDGTPEAYAATIGKYAPRVVARARRWAMARYYVTPTFFDTVNTREIPASAADLLIRGQALDPALRPMDMAAPVEQLFGRLTHTMPGTDVVARAPAYCAAVLEVRGLIPRARKVFADVRARAELSTLSDELTQLMTAELLRQQGLRRYSGWTYTLMTSLAAGSPGFVIGEPAVGLAVGAATGAAQHAGGQRVRHLVEGRRRPWPLAIDVLTERVSAPS